MKQDSSLICSLARSAQPVTVRIVADRDGKPKGFGYIEFESLDALKDALSRSGAPLAGRPVRVGVAEPPKSTGDRPGFGPSAAEEASQWRRAGPLPPSSNDGPSSRPGMGSRERSTGGFGGPRDGPSGFDNMEVGAGGRSGFGSKFQSSPSGPGAQGRAGPPPPREPLEPSKGEVASDWRTGKPMEGRPSRPAFQGRGGEEGSSRSPSFRQHREATDVDEKYAGQERMGFGSKFVATPPDSPSTGRGPGGQRRGSGQQHGGAGGAGDSADTWRSARSGGKPAGATSPLGGNASASPAPPAERKKLDLKPRGSSTTTEATTAAEAATSSRASPFGNAKPVDSSEREKAIEERIRKEREQRAAEEAARRAEREKATKDAPSGPRADRAKAASAGVTGEAKSTANDGNKDIPATTEVSPAPAAAAAAAAASSTPKSPPPTGAWGGGRAASGALAAKQQQEKATNGDTSTADLAKGVEGVKVSGAEDDKTDA